MPVSRLLSTFATIWRIARPYFYSEDRWAGRILLAAVIVIELSTTAINVMFNWWNNRFYNALQERNWETFIYELGVFCVLATAFILLAVYQLYLRQWLQIRWRAWMTEQYLDRWLAGGNHYRMQLLGDAADNPDQRISEDISLFVERFLYIGLRLLGSVVTFFSFIVILWTLSESAPFHLFGYEIAIPGYLVWAALIYAIVGTALTHLIGSPLIGLSFQQQRYEADFRFNLVRVRENSEQIALLQGETPERHRLLNRFANVIANWRAIMLRTKKLTFLTVGYQQFANVFPFLVVSPAYFAGRIQLGGLMQTSSAFGSVQESLSIIITVYRELAEWRAVIARLDGFDSAIAQGRAAATAKPGIEVLAGEGRSSVEVDDLLVRLPQGMPLVAADDITLSAGERVLVTGPSGAGKSTLFRALAGTWPFGAGTVVVPKGAKAMTLPQRPYFPIGTLAAAVTYPAEPGTFSSEALAETIAAVGLPALAARLAEEAHWNRMLSLGEQQRLGLARAILQAPDYLFLDEATASLDEPAETALYRLLDERLKGTTIVSIGHRSTLFAFHRRHLALVRDGDRFRVREVAVEPAAE
jgi:putative ATP-binding cassette transporter